MLRDGQKSGLVTLQRGIGVVGGSRLWAVSNEAKSLCRVYSALHSMAASSPSCMTLRDARTTASAKAARASTYSGPFLSIRRLGGLAAWMAIQSPMRRELRDCADR